LSTHKVERTKGQRRDQLEHFETNETEGEEEVEEKKLSWRRGISSFHHHAIHLIHTRAIEAFRAAIISFPMRTMEPENRT
jgi:hypothetical protein